MAIGGIIPTKVTVIGGRSGSGKCLAPGTEILYADGTLHKVEDVKVGNILLGPDGPTEVMSTTSGYDQMFRIHQNKGDFYDVNSCHILSLSYRNREINIQLNDFLKKSAKFQKECKGYRRVAQFPERNLKLDPYFLGLWLGDGSTSKTVIYTTDKEIENYVVEYCNSLPNTTVRVKQERTCRDLNIKAHSDKGTNRGGSYIWREFKKLNLLNNKHIPKEYLISSADQRRKLLAGLIDTDGSFHKNCWEITTKLKSLAADIKFLSNSLGYRASVNDKIVKGRVYYRVFISGNDLNLVPIRLERKKIKITNKLIDKRNTGIKIESLGHGKYYGFELTVTHRRFFLKDCTVTHNTALTAPMFEATARRKSDGSRVEYLFFTWELDPSIVIDRAISAKVGLTVRQLNQGAKLLSEKTMAQIKSAYEVTSKYPITYQPYSIDIDEVIALSTDFVKKCQEKAEIEGNYIHPVVCIDYLNMAQFENAGLRTYGIAHFMNTLKKFCNHYKASAIVFTQISRETDKTNKIPDRADFSDSAAIENAADNLIAIYRPEYHQVKTILNPETGLEIDSDGKMLLRVLKCRDYGTGDFLLNCDIKYYRFWDLTQDTHDFKYYEQYKNPEFWMREFNVAQQYA
jgi:replicative DNA helicase